MKTALWLHQPFILLLILSLTSKGRTLIYKTSIKNIAHYLFFSLPLVCFSMLKNIANALVTITYRNSRELIGRERLRESLDNGNGAIQTEQFLLHLSQKRDFTRNFAGIRYLNFLILQQQQQSVPCLYRYRSENELHHEMLKDLRWNRSPAARDSTWVLNISWRHFYDFWV